jgi:hypothetical protein
MLESRFPLPKPEQQPNAPGLPFWFFNGKEEKQRAKSNEQ